MNLPTKARTLRGLRLSELMAERQRRGASTVEPVRAWAVLAVLLLSANEAGECWPSIQRLATESQMPARTVQAVLAVLEDAGLVSVTSRRHVPGRRATSNLYQLDLARLEAMSGGDAGADSRAAAAPDHAQPLRQITRSGGVTHAQPLQESGAAAAPGPLEDGIVKGRIKGVEPAAAGDAEGPDARILGAYPAVAGSVWQQDLEAVRAAIRREAATAGGATVAEILAAVQELRRLPGRASWARTWFGGRGYWPAVQRSRMASSATTTGQQLRAMREAEQRQEQLELAELRGMPPAEREAVMQAAAAAVRSRTGGRSVAGGRMVEVEALAILRMRKSGAVA